MRRSQPRVHAAVPIAVVVGLAASCVPRYRPPTADQPHAVVKLRRTYSSLPGPSLRESASINEHVAFAQTSRPTKAPRTDSVLVHPGPASWNLGATFYHMETRRVRESYQEREPYQDQESYNCGTYENRRTCYRSVTKYRYETKYRYVNKQVEVVDDACSASVSHSADEGSVYLLQLTYQGNGVCRASCFVQTGSDGEVAQQPCH